MASLRNEERQILARYLAGARENPVNDPDEERALAWRARRDGEALERLVRSNLGLVGKVAWGFRGMGLPVEDVLHEGVVGLLEAARRFDVSRGNRFSTYAVWWIRKRILAALRDSATPLRFPSYPRRQIRRIREAESALRAALGREPRRDEISDRMSTSVKRVDGLLGRVPTQLGLEDWSGNDASLRVSDRLADTRRKPPDVALIDRESKRFLAEALEHLPRRDRLVLAYRFGFDGSPPLTLREVGAKLRISRERVRQVEVEAIAVLRRMYDRRGPSRPNRPDSIAS